MIILKLIFEDTTLTFILFFILLTLVANFKVDTDYYTFEECIEHVAIK